MRAILAEAAAVAAALLLAGAAVGPGHDRGLLVPPPEAAAENFLKAMTEHRYTRARQHLAGDLRDTAPDTLAALERSVEQARGPVQKVQGRGAVIAGDESTARASIDFENGGQDLRLPLRREKGLWKVSSLQPLRELAEARRAPDRRR